MNTNYNFDFKAAEWRLMRTPPAEGAWNMALDEAVLISVLEGASLPTLRLYDWNPACLSLGYAQPLSDVLVDKLEEDGLSLVRRVTGGRAILHVDELTYSVIGPQDDPRLTGGVLESYRILSAALLVALQSLGIPARSEENANSANTPAQKQKNPVCFEVPSNYEITVDGKKLIGSAQARRRNGVLQHGTFPLLGDITRIVNYLKFSGETSRNAAAERLKQRALTAADVTGNALTWDRAAQAFQEAFEERLNITFHAQGLTSEEERVTEELLEEKYASLDWTGRILS